jgi:hypothetical protein
MARYLIEFHLPSVTRAEFARLARVIRSAHLRIERNSHEPRVDAIGLVSNGLRTYCVVRARSARQVGRLIQTAMLAGRILKVTELEPRR